MQLSFEFEDFFRHKTAKGVEGNDIKTPTFLLQSGVIGDLRIRNLPQSILDDEGVKLEVKLEGMMKTQLDTSLDNRAEFRLTVEKKILSMTQAFSMHRYSTSSRNDKLYAFNFDVQSWMEHNTQNNEQQRALATRASFATLPPSLRHEISRVPQGVPKPRAGACVTYHLIARLFKGSKTITGTGQQVLLLHSSESPAPPTCLADFKGEYRPTQRTSLRGSLFQKLGDVTVAVSEPKQLSVKAMSRDSLVEMPVKLCLDTAVLGNCDIRKFCIEAEVNWQFLFSTFVSIVERKGPATLSEAIRSPATAYVKSSLKPRSLNMTWRNWQEQWNPDGSSQLISEQSLWLSLSRAEVLTPTFWTPLISRRYSICLQIKIGKPGTAKLEVEVPIQVGIEAASLAQHAECMRQAREDWLMEGDELLPQYVR